MEFGLGRRLDPKDEGLEDEHPGYADQRDH